MFERSWVRILVPCTGWTFSTLICRKGCIVCLNRPKINEKEAGVGPFFKSTTLDYDRKIPLGEYSIKQFKPQN